MKKSDIVRKNQEFERILANNNVVKNKSFVIYYIDNSFQKNRYGISVSKKIGNAVTRNYYKRIIRNICDKNNFVYSKSKDYIIIMRKGCINLNFEKINEEFAHLINKIEKIEKETNYEETN